MNLELLFPYLEKAANNPQLPAAQAQATQLLSNHFDPINHQEDDQVVDSDIEKKNPEEAGNQKLELEDHLLHTALPELVEKDPDDFSSFGKTSHVTLFSKLASAYVRDLPITALPKTQQADVTRFVGEGLKQRQVIEYGMVVSELLPKVDPHNFKLAEDHIKTETASKSRRAALDEFFAKAKDKYILILNDKIIDGHHFLAKAKHLKITSSLKVLDLTPVRFQEKKAGFSLSYLKR